jgi:CRISPR system Cascade subunit CasD
MPNVLLLRFAAPMQAWGTSSRFSIRETGKEPSKSGVIGLLCAALGISRDEANTNNLTFNDLTKLKFGVRVNREGVMQKDYHTAQNIAKADGSKPNKETELSTRWYLADADFLVGLESEDFQLLETLQNAVKNPKWQLFLGRKSFVPSVPIYLAKDGINNGELEDVLSKFVIEEFDNADKRLIIENINGNEVRQDVPLCLKTRRFSLRRVETKFIPGGKNDRNLSDQIAA